MKKLIKVLFFGLICIFSRNLFSMQQQPAFSYAWNSATHTFTVTIGNIRYQLVNPGQPNQRLEVTNQDGTQSQINADQIQEFTQQLLQMWQQHQGTQPQIRVPAAHAQAATQAQQDGGRSRLRNGTEFIALTIAAVLFVYLFSLTLSTDDVVGINQRRTEFFRIIFGSLATFTGGTGIYLLRDFIRPELVSPNYRPYVVGLLMMLTGLFGYYGFENLGQENMNAIFSCLGALFSGYGVIHFLRM